MLAWKRAELNEMYSSRTAEWPPISKLQTIYIFCSLLIVPTPCMPATSSAPIKRSLPNHMRLSSEASRTICA